MYVHTHLHDIEKSLLTSAIRMSRDYEGMRQCLGWYCYLGETMVILEVFRDLEFPDDKQMFIS